MDERKISVLGLLPPGLLILQLLLPLCKLIAFLAGMEFAVYNVGIYAIASTALMLIGVTILFIREVRQDVMYLLICAAALVNGYLWQTETELLPIIPAVLNALAAAALLLRRGGTGKLAVGIISILLALGIGCHSFLTVFAHHVFGGIEDTVAHSLSSPDGSYTADVIHRQFGFTNSFETLVTIHDHQGAVSVLFGRFTHPTQPVYSASNESTGYPAVTIEWADEDTLIINGEYYDLEDLP